MSMHQHIYQWTPSGYKRIYYRMDASSADSGMGGYQHIEWILRYFNQLWAEDTVWDSKLQNNHSGSSGSLPTT